tara:strand:- start:457 stop:1326 length:870 start_codon:yes stop_codon:yes gene_type:complete
MEQVKKQKVLLLGSAGMIGHQIHRKLYETNKYVLYDSSFSHKLSDKTIILDLRDLEKSFDVLSRINPDILINCSGLLIEESKQNIKDAILLNAYIPHFLREFCDKINSKFIQISTDCVFSGKNPPYTEQSAKDGQSVYAKVKGLGEIDTENHLTIRTSVIGPDLKTNGKELFSWFLNQKKEIDGYYGSIWSGVSSINLGESIDLFIDQKITGIYNFCSPTNISKYELLSMLNRHSNRDLKINKTEGFISDKTLIDTRKELDFKLRSYEETVEELLNYTKESGLYPHYNL